MSGEGLIAEPRAVHPSAGHARLKELMHRGTEFLGCDVAIMGGAMSWVSERNLVSAISNAGGFGVIACGAMSAELLDAEIAETKARTSRPFGVNLITMHPQLAELIDVCAKHEVGHVVLAGGLPPGWALDKIKANGAKLMAFAPALALAKKLMRSNVDALVIEGMEAGGHIGPVSTSVLAQEILPVVSKDIPVFMAGGIGRGEAMAAYLEMGAVGVQLGTRFVCAHESIAHANFKKAFIRACRSRSTRACRSFRCARSRMPRPSASPPSSGRSQTCSTRARSKWPRPSFRSSITGPARCAER